MNLWVWRQAGRAQDLSKADEHPAYTTHGPSSVPD